MKTETGSEYRRYLRRKVVLIVTLMVAAVVIMGLSLSVGGREIGFMDTYRVMFEHILGVNHPHGTDPWLDDYIVWDVRLPRAIFAMIAGATLAVCGASMQSVLNNPLADQYTTGVSSGACFGVSVAVVLGMTVAGSGGIYSIGAFLNAFVFSLIPIAFIIALAPMMRSSPASLILAGVAISYIFNAFNTLLMVLTDSQSLADIYVWQVGTVSDVYWNDLSMIALLCIPTMLLVMFLSDKLNILSTGDNTAKSLGLNVDNLKIVILSVTALAVAIIVCNAGIIGFIGLISPHLVRMLVDSDNRFVIPASAAMGAVILMGADLISRILSPQGAIPVGVVMSFIGAPVLLYLIVRRNSNVY